VDFLLVLIELFVGATGEALRVNIDWKSAISLRCGQFDAKLQVEWVTFHRPFFFSENLAKWFSRRQSPLAFYAARK